jgi:hypothetical protein
MSHQAISIMVDICCGVSVWAENAYLSIAALQSTIMALTSNVRLEDQSLIETVQRV